MRIRYSNIRNKVDAASSRVSPAARKRPNAPLQLDYEYEHRSAKAELSTSTIYDGEKGSVVPGGTLSPASGEGRRGGEEEKKRSREDGKTGRREDGKTGRREDGKTGRREDMRI